MNTAFAQLLLLERCSECVPQDCIHILNDTTFCCVDDTETSFYFRYDYENGTLTFIGNEEN